MRDTGGLGWLDHWRMEWSGVCGVIDGAQRLEERWEWGVGSGWDW